MRIAAGVILEVVSSIDPGDFLFVRSVSWICRSFQRRGSCRAPPGRYGYPHESSLLFCPGSMSPLHRSLFLRVGSASCFTEIRLRSDKPVLRESVM